MYSTAVVRTPGQRAGITRDNVVAAARAILHEEGLAAVSMRHVAARLDVAPNALYSHVADKNALIALLIDAMLDGIEAPTSGPWRDRVTKILADTRTAMLAHGDLVPLCLSRQTIGPNALRLGEAILAALHVGGIEGEAAVRALQLMLVHTIGASAFEVGRRDDPDPVSRQRRGQETAAALDPATHPHTSGQSEAISRFPGETVFQLGLRLLLDGLARDAGNQ